ncbi:MAG: antibiotic biosynthesis monooxygenase [Alphaproteobacteria bacterium]|jgi:quinol monooxygenase YgiN|nr:hypothetical protein [Rhodobiaceae bacterium]MBO6544592.1 antibiotic biosynthesis monooxygenase [Alphaproteobacteria bacterium]MBO6627993.1 antibiotic biosynthesis monooxygenase [Alphaproteobacteria bacterium]MDF1625563.1 antibiotic biosynthesis monooxygenase [Parvibaculaceae bacterium]|tara:strand:- start:378 stop:680 length:303 start_codon:yes stop_codon:yes gene_type:complete
MIIVNGKIETGTAEDIERVSAALRARMERTRQEPGCIDYSFAIEVGAPNVMHVLEKWESEDALNTHLQVPDEAFSQAIATANVKSASIIAYTATGERVLR